MNGHFKLQTHPNNILTILDSRMLADARGKGDPAADEYMADVMASPGFDPSQLRDLANLAEIYPLPPELEALLENPMELPAWADHGKLVRAQQYYAQNSISYGFVLLIYSLPLMFAWGTGGAQTLVMNQDLLVDYRRRVHYTLDFLNTVFAPGAFSAGGKAGSAILRVRLMHAYVRAKALKACQWQPEWGAPVNQEKIIATALSFSLVAVKGMRRLGWRVKVEDEDALLHFWRVVAVLLGVEESFAQFDIKNADQIWNECAKDHFCRTNAGVKLVHAHFNFIGSLTSPATARALTTLTEILVGESIAENLALPRSKRIHTWLWRGIIATRKASGGLELPTSVYMPKLEDVAKHLHKKISQYDPAAHHNAYASRHH